jgi:hypothetical protein
LPHFAEGSIEDMQSSVDYFVTAVITSGNDKYLDRVLNMLSNYERRWRMRR